ncbi:MAG: hypothetical protein C0501_27030 [Isosphaera sp.]|nr:hypothetical protein [Isosphaera sp.]
MSRAAVLLLALAPGLAAAQGPDPFRVVDAEAKKDRLFWTVTEVATVAEQVAVEVEVNGVKRVEFRTVTKLVPVTTTRAVELNTVKVTDAAGKAIPADKLAERLKEPAPVVLVTGPVTDKHRALFKDTTIFVELPAAPAVPK